MPRTRKTAARRKRDYVLPNEVDRLLKAATSTGRHAHRNYTLILLGYRHGLRLSELIDLRWSMIDFKRKTLRVSRALNGIDTVHPLGKKELQALRKLRKDYPRSAYLFITDSGRQLGQRSFYLIYPGLLNRLKRIGLFPCLNCASVIIRLALTVMHRMT